MLVTKLTPSLLQSTTTHNAHSLAGVSDPKFPLVPTRPPFLPVPATEHCHEVRMRRTDRRMFARITRAASSPILLRQIRTFTSTQHYRCDISFPLCGSGNSWLSYFEFLLPRILGKGIMGLVRNELVNPFPIDQNNKIDQE